MTATLSRTGVWIVVTLLSTTLPAQEVFVEKKTTFNPVLLLGQRYTDNVLFINTAAEDPSDSSTRIRIRLPVVRRLRNGSVSFTYSTGYQKYRDNEALDNTGHRLSVGYSTRPDRFSSLSLSGSYFLTQDQAILEAVNDEDGSPFISDPFLSQRTKRVSYGARVRYHRTLSRRWSMNSYIRGTKNRFNAITGGDVADVENRTTYGASFRVSRSLTPKTSIGVRYRYDTYDLEDSPDESVQRLSITVGHSFSERFALDFNVGGHQRTEDLVGGGTEKSTGVNVGLNARFNEGLEFGPVRLSFFAGVRPSAGLPYSGTATNSVAAISVSRAADRAWDWNFSAKYTRRNPNRRSDTNPGIRTLSIGPTVERRIRELFGVRIGQRYVDQHRPGSDRNNGSFYSFSVSLVWYPLGRTRIANT